AQTQRELGVVDFHDLEQFTLRLLLDDTRKATALAEHWRTRFKLIFVDEYQDINAAQDAILCALSRDGAKANRFLVGDVKQSIYRFRLADPHIFQTYAREWKDDPACGQVITLSDNFRSHEGILGFVNAFFGALMRAEMGGVQFGPDARLRFGNAGTREALTWAGEMKARLFPSPKPHVELHLRIIGGSESDNDDAAEEEENGASGPLLSDLSNVENETPI